MERIPTGIEGLDRILQGGIPRYASVLVAGRPGTGKTILTQHMLFHNARPDHKSIYFSTLSEPQIKVLLFQQQFEFFKPEKFLESVIFHDLGSTLRNEGAAGALRAMDALVQQHRPALVAVDSIRAFLDFLPTPDRFREFISDLAVRLPAWECTTLLVGEYVEEEIQSRPEAAIVDGIFYLYGTEERKHQKRYLRILKMRGTDYAAGENLFKITRQGVQVYPRLNPEVRLQRYQQSDRRLSTGVPGLDQMTGGGLPEGTTTLVCGSTGTGKTVLALHWLVAGVRAGEPSLLVTFEESPHQLRLATRDFGWDLDGWLRQGLLRIHHVSPMELDVDELFHELRDLVQDGVRRVAVDSISSFEIGMADKHKYTDYIWALTDWFKSQGVSLMLLNETHDLYANNLLSKHGLSFVADNIILLEYVRLQDRIQRRLAVLKMRGCRHDTALREFVIGPGGLMVLGPEER